MLEVKYCGFDFGQCIQNPGGLRNPLVFGDICKELGAPERIPEAVRRYRVLKEKYGTYGRIKEGHRDEISSFVLDGDPRATELFAEKEQEYLDMAEGLVEALDFLKARGLRLQVITEMKKTLGPVGTDFISTFLKRRGLVKYFEELRFDGVYLASVAAFLEDRPDATPESIAGSRLRDLRTNKMVKVGT